MGNRYEDLLKKAGDVISDLSDTIKDGKAFMNQAKVSLGYQQSETRTLNDEMGGTETSNADENVASADVAVDMSDGGEENDGDEKTASEGSSLGTLLEMKAHKIGQERRKQRKHLKEMQKMMREHAVDTHVANLKKHHGKNNNHNDRGR